MAHSQSLPEVAVQASPLNESLGLDLSATSGALSSVSVQDLPASLSSVSGVQWREREDNAVADAVSRTVGLSTTASPGNGGLSFASRGFSGVNSVGVAEDGLSLGVAAGTIAYPSDTWGYERLDVLRGPASLLYGSGNMGATINAVRKAPSAIRSTEVLSGLGSDGAVRLGLGTTGAIGETLTYRVDAYGQRSDGERELGRNSSSKLMTSLRWQPRSDFKLDLTADIANQKPERYFGLPTVDGKPVRELRDHNYNVSDSDIRYKDKRVRAKAEWTLSPDVTLRNELYYTKADRHWQNIEGYDYTPTDNSIYRYDYLEIGHDLQQTGNRLSSAWKLGSHQLALGWDISEAKFTALNNSPYSGDSVVDASAPRHGLWDSPDAYRARMSSKLKQHAFFIEDAWNVTPDATLMAGIRRDIYDFNRLDLLSNARVTSQLGGTSWRLGASYKLNPNTNIYAQVTQGHDPVTSMLSLSQSNASFKLSQGRQVEVGLKQKIADGRGEWTVAVYDIQKKDIITRDPVRPTISVQGGKQSSQGIEASAAWQANRLLRFEGNIGYTDAKFDELREGSTGADRKGNRPSNIPRYTANLWTHVEEGPWSASLGLRYVGDRFMNNANTSKLPSYTVADAVLRWKYRPDTTFSLVVRNLGNRFYASSAYGSQWLVGAGRTAELTAHWRF